MIITTYKSQNKKIKKRFSSLKNYKNFISNINKKGIVQSVSPSKIIAIGLNYFDHAEEMKKKPPKEPLIFLKAPSTIDGPY